MQLFLRVPLFTRESSELDRRREALNRWWDQEGSPSLKKIYGFSYLSKEGLGPGDSFVLMQESEFPIEVRFPKGEPGRPALVLKGVLIRLHLLGVLDFVDRINPCQRDDAYFVMVDGSGAFSFGNVFTILDALLGAPPRPDVVFGERPAEDTGMAPWRRAIELFEEHLLVAVRGAAIGRCGYERLPDSQAGCWGVRLSALRRLALTARNYEIEYDLLASVLESDISFKYVGPLVMQERGASDYGVTPDAVALGTSVHKLSFIMHKLGLTSEELVDHLKNFMRKDSQSCGPLPEGYVERVVREFAPGRISLR